MTTRKGIFIVAISDIKIKETIFALTESSRSLKPRKTILFTSKNIILNTYQSNLIDLVRISPINSIRDYSHFIIYKLHNFINSSHVLIVQWDGYVIDKNKWRNNFLNYDYIGAPFIPRVNDQEYSNNEKGAFFVIGNGGFSLRSKKLLAAPSKYKLKDNFNFTNFHEDGFFSVFHREFLESKGFSWAPFKLAKKFSIETIVSFKDIQSLPLGFHGKRMLLVVRVIKRIKILVNIFRKIKLLNYF